MHSETYPTNHTLSTRHGRTLYELLCYYRIQWPIQHRFGCSDLVATD